LGRAFGAVDDAFCGRETIIKHACEFDPCETRDERRGRADRRAGPGWRRRSRRCPGRPMKNAGRRESIARAGVAREARWRQDGRKSSG
jgi:hypothetical protein